MTTDRPNPMRELLHQQLGIDSFALDGEALPLEASWQDEPRREVPATAPATAVHHAHNAHNTSFTGTSSAVVRFSAKPREARPASAMKAA